MDAATARMRLESVLAELDRSIAVLRGDPSVRDRSGPDGGSVLTETDRDRALLEAAVQHRRAVMEAMARLDGGRYGLCVDCAAAVPEGRLQARPEAERCVPCQSRRERRR
ncbi:TraR/DksA family transcriptional regulator [Streptosporangium sp. NPDC004379]|uniref:TraR/DksA family transcriptional regulator n=1 Tax=Streptosporangium sp. NPDC004379 TaxID=3366189 RepID=UPI0036CD7AFF